ncbi:hypothetical protein GCM10009760_13900 [Kitasatospora kazusensis]|uniref:Uncharacterized protein n=1 Tax=Kitasatospora kazusensis TaxID=407974 RepID=A0ABP5KPZ6_9ACTN
MIVALRVDAGTQNDERGRDERSEHTGQAGAGPVRGGRANLQFTWRPAGLVSSGRLRPRALPAGDGARPAGVRGLPLRQVQELAGGGGMTGPALMVPKEEPT